MDPGVRILALLLCAFVAPLAHAQWDARYQVRLFINDVPVVGTDEIETQAATAPDRGSVYDANRPREFAAETSFQEQVKIVDQSSGQVVDYTGSPRVQYDETFGCATASNLGVITMTPMTGTPCAGSPEYPVVMILLVDASGQAIAANSYLFHVVSGTTPPR